MTERRPYPSNRQRVEDYYGVHDTGMAARPAAPRPAPTNGPQTAPNRRVIPPGDGGEPVEAQFVEVTTHGPSGPTEVSPADANPVDGAGHDPFGRATDGFYVEHPRSKPDPLTDPLTSETFQGVQPESDTFGTGPTTEFGYSTDVSAGRVRQTDSTNDYESGFDGSYDQFAPPRFEPRAEGTWSDDGIVSESADFDDSDSYIDVEVVEVEAVETFTAAVDPTASETEHIEDVADGGAGTHGAAPAPETSDDFDAPDDSGEADRASEEQTEGDAESDSPRPRFPQPLALDPYPYTQIDETYVDPATLSQPKEPGTMTDFNDSLKEAMNIEGALGVALVDADSGMALATAGDPTEFNLEVAAAGNSGLVKAMGRTLGDIDLDDHIEDILITLGSQYQIVRPIQQGTDDLFLYLVLDRTRANLAMARFRLTKLAENIEV